MECCCRLGRTGQKLMDWLRAHRHAFAIDELRAFVEDALFKLA
jgi:hypothetical protein